ncbi:MAG: hypothetical protein E7137_02600 [Rikenellaceae bacterium]|nr:hypothetical protein [Rikenellaceae bacterium]
MKKSGRTLKQRLYGLGQLPGRVARARYFRGHGVHSPYVYSIVRQVFMQRNLLTARRDLCDELLALGAPRRRAIQLQNLMIHCGYATYAINCLPAACPYAIVTSEVDEATTLALVGKAEEQGCTLVLASPYNCRERTELCQRIVAHHKCTSVDNRGYLILFNNHLPKQHFKL